MTTTPKTKTPAGPWVDPDGLPQGVAWVRLRGGDGAMDDAETNASRWSAIHTPLAVEVDGRVELACGKRSRHADDIWGAFIFDGLAALLARTFPGRITDACPDGLRRLTRCKRCQKVADTGGLGGE